MAIIIYLEPQEDGKRLKVVTRAEAEALVYYLNHPEEVTDDKQLERLARIQDVHLGRLPRKVELNMMEQETSTDHLTNEGVDQGMMSALPRNDR